jgi:signal transduction histidine kinase
MIWPLSLRGRIYLILGTLALITLLGGLVLVWYTYRMERLLNSVVDVELPAFQAAEALETAIVNQKGLVSYFIMDGDPQWLEQLMEYRRIFNDRLDEVRTLSAGGEDLRQVEEIESEYRQYILKKDRVIQLYRSGNRQAGAELHPTVRRHFFKVLELCENYKQLHQNRILQARAESRSQALKLRIASGTAVLVGFGLAFLLAFVLVNQVLIPLRRLSAETVNEAHTRASKDEVKDLSRHVRGLIQNMDHAKSELEKSRESLLQAEKMAMVGRLAAGMAHSIRNPFTSVKMRLFSLGRSLELNSHQQEDFDVISEEIRHIDTIVQNFLEFSRPPRLKVQPVSPSIIVDSAVQLLKHRLESYDVSVHIRRAGMLPEIEADPEQLKEVFVNLIVNACEAMESGGTIAIEEHRTGNGEALIRVSDNGPGIPDSIHDKVLQPFFTTKEDGTGLGLSIAARVVSEHGGRMEIESREGGGTSFTIALPFRRKAS